MDSSGGPPAVISAKVSGREFDVVDGQQRLVTLVTLFAVLRDLEESPKKPVGRRVAKMMMAEVGTRFFRTERRRLHIATRERGFFESYVMAPGGSLLDPPDRPLSESENAILAARNHFVTELKRWSDADRAQLFEYVAERCEVAVILSHDIDRAHRMFVVLNERGKKLQKNDILKADVLSRLPANKIDWAAREWDGASHRVGDEFEKFFTHLRTIYGHTRPQVVSAVRAVMAEEGGPEPFLEKAFLPLADAYAAIRVNSDDPALGLTRDMRRYLTYLNRLADGDWAPAAMLALRDRAATPERTVALLAEIDRLSHLLRLLCLGVQKRSRRLAAVADAIRSGATPGPDHEVFQITRDEVRNIAFHLKDLHERNQKVCKLVLMRLGDEMDGTLIPAVPETYTIEHVLPQRPSRTSEWMTWFPTNDERAVCTESLGNLVLITKGQNDRAKNASFEAKKQVFADARDGLPILPITRGVLECQEWRRFEIEAREEHLFELIRKTWRIDLPAPRSMPRAANPAAKPADAPVLA
ncbi:MAG: DUF262 domain-containing protein, partial [Hyphomicrobium sp.]